MKSKRILIICGHVHMLVVPAVFIAWQVVLWHASIMYKSLYQCACVDLCAYLL